MATRTIILGTTGVDKTSALKNLTKFRDTYTRVSDLHCFDFVKDFIEPRMLLHEWLDSTERSQRNFWNEGWLELQKKTNKISGDIILSLHGVIVRPLYGKRSPVNFDLIKAFKPDKVITLIDDVYMQWFRTEKRAGGRGYRGRPSLEQLLDARRAEIFLGDMLVNHLDINPRECNSVLAVRHPARTLDQLIFGSHRQKCVYLSFPISGPRRRLAQGDYSGIEEINSFLKYTATFERSNPGLVFFCPLTIDEFPLLRTVENDRDDSEYVEFSLKDRWDVRDFWSDETLLTDDAETPASIKLVREQVQSIRGMVSADVPTRDYRLVMQSHCVAVYNPWFDGKRSAGVDNEIACALFFKKPVHIYQNEHHDPKREAIQYLKRSAGSLGTRPGDEYVVVHNSPEAMLEAFKGGT